MKSDAVSGIGVINERSLHNALKEHYCAKGYSREVTVGTYIVDIFSPEGHITEIQTSSLSHIRNKLSTLLHDYRVTLVYPIAAEKRLCVYDRGGEDLLYSRKSPKRGGTADIFREAIHIRDILLHPNFDLEVVFIKEEELRVKDGKGSWRRGGTSIADRRLVSIVERIRLTNADDYRRLLPSTLPSLFSNSDVAQALSITAKEAGRITYCLKTIGILKNEGKQGRFLLYSIS